MPSEISLVISEDFVISKLSLGGVPFILWFLIKSVWCFNKKLSLALTLVSCRTDASPA